ncbi:hypothetical protein AAH978_07110 [Streptomyces sp. ZYX-F-203]
MSEGVPSVDPIGDHARALASAVRGPAGVKARMIEALRLDLEDAASDHGREGVPYRTAARRAVRESGTVAELADSWQRELTIAQTRRTARAVAATVPLLVACRYLVHRTDSGRGPELAFFAQALASHLTCLAGIAAVLAGAALIVTGPVARRFPTPGGLPSGVAWSATVAGASTALAALALAVAVVSGADRPPLFVAGVFAAASHAVVAGSARACRRCRAVPAA